MVDGHILYATYAEEAEALSQLTCPNKISVMAQSVLESVGVGRLFTMCKTAKSKYENIFSRGLARSGRSARRVGGASEVTMLYWPKPAALCAVCSPSTHPTRPKQSRSEESFSCKLSFHIVCLEKPLSKIRVFPTYTGPTVAFAAVRGLAATTGAAPDTGGAARRGHGAIRCSNGQTHLGDTAAHMATAARPARLTSVCSCVADAGAMSAMVAQSAVLRRDRAKQRSQNGWPN
jgi:hypothetical protein